MKGHYSLYQNKPFFFFLFIIYPRVLNKIETLPQICVYKIGLMHTEQRTTFVGV